MKDALKKFLEGKKGAYEFIEEMTSSDFDIGMISNPNGIDQDEEDENLNPAIAGVIEEYPDDMMTYEMDEPMDYTEPIMDTFEMDDEYVDPIEYTTPDEYTDDDIEPDVEDYENYYTDDIDVEDDVEMDTFEMDDNYDDDEYYTDDPEPVMDNYEFDDMGMSMDPAPVEDMPMDNVNAMMGDLDVEEYCLRREGVVGKKFHKVVEADETYTYHGKKYTVKIFTSEEAANSFMERNDEWALLDTKDDKIYLAKKSDLGKKESKNNDRKLSKISINESVYNSRKSVDFAPLSTSTFVKFKFLYNSGMGDVTVQGTGTIKTSTDGKKFEIVTNKPGVRMVFSLPFVYRVEKDEENGRIKYYFKDNSDLSMQYD